MAVNGNHHRKANSGLGGGDGNGKNCDYHADWLLRGRTETPESNEIQVRRGQHHFNADENENGVAPTERGEEADGEQRRGNDEENLERWSHG